MVSHLLIASSGLLTQQSAAANQVPEPVRTAALMTLLGIALLGLLIVVIILLGGHWVRRLGKYRRGPAVPPDTQLRNTQSSETPPTPSSSANSGETSGPDETMVS